MRRSLAQKHRLQEFRVFENATLEEMAEKRPVTPEAMLEIYGVGAVKMERFGWDFLQVIKQCTGMNAGRRSPQPTQPSNTVQRDDREFAAVPFACGEWPMIASQIMENLIHLSAMKPSRNPRPSLSQAPLIGQTMCGREYQPADKNVVPPSRKDQVTCPDCLAKQQSSSFI